MAFDTFCDAFTRLYNSDVYIQTATARKIPPWILYFDFKPGSYADHKRIRDWTQRLLQHASAARLSFNHSLR